MTQGRTRAGAGERVERVLRAQLAGASWNTVRQLIQTGKVFLDGQVVLDAAELVAPTVKLEVRMAAPRPRSGPLDFSAILYVDAQVLVLRKPPGLSSVPHENEATSLQELAERLLRARETGLRARETGLRARQSNGGRARLYAVHRLDKVSSGIVVFARSASALRALKEQFREHSVERRYLALAHGTLSTTTLRSQLVSDRGDQRRGSTQDENRGQLAITHVTLLERLQRCCLVECRLETGRTHQIRIHLAEHGHPLVGELVYRGRAGTAVIDAPRTLLHASSLDFTHPETHERLKFVEPLPEDFTAVLERERLR